MALGRPWRADVSPFGVRGSPGSIDALNRLVLAHKPFTKGLLCVSAVAELAIGSPGASWLGQRLGPHIPGRQGFVPLQRIDQADEKTLGGLPDLRTIPAQPRIGARASQNQVAVGGSISLAKVVCEPRVWKLFVCPMRSTGFGCPEQVEDDGHTFFVCQVENLHEFINLKHALSGF